MEGAVWEVGVGYFKRKERCYSPEGGTLAPDEPLLCKTGTIPGSGLVLNVAAVSLLDYRSNYLICKGTLSKED